MPDLIRKTAETAADWWTERLMQGDKAAFRASLVASIEAELRRDDWSEGDWVDLECDYDPQGALLDAVRAAGIECAGSFFSARGILPQKHSTEIAPGRIVPKEGYGNWTAEIKVEDDDA
jgi:hypothetical protein